MSYPRLALLALLIVGHLVVTGLLTYVSFRMQGSSFLGTGLMLVAVAFVVSQDILISYWAALSTTPFVLRLPTAFFLCVLQWSAAVVGGAQNFASYGESMAGYWGAFIAGGFALSFVAFAILGFFLPWSITVTLSTTPPPPSRARSQFSLGQLILGVTLGCVAAGFVRSLAPAETGMTPGMMLEMSFTGAGFMFLSLLISLPCIAVAYVQISEHALYFAVWWILYAALVSLVVAGVLAALSGGGSDAPQIAGVLFLYNSTLCLSVYTGVLCLRALGPAPAATHAAIE